MTFAYPFQSNKKIWVLTIAFSLVLAFIFRAYLCLGDILSVNDSGVIIRSFLSKVLGSGWTYLCFLIFAGINTVLVQFPKVLSWIFKYRYLLALIVFIVCVVFAISGSSIGMWCNLFGVEDTDLLLGISRDIRSDEFCVSTPSYLMQSYSGNSNAYDYFSDVMNGTTSDMFFGMRQPVAEPVMLFRPFLTGYLFLPGQQALAFYWCGRGIMLFLASLELGLLITNRKRELAFIVAVLLTLSPTTQWWYSTAIVDMIIYTGFSLCLFARYMKEKKFLLRLLLLIGILWCAGAFIMILYPAWQLPFVFIILLMAVWILITQWKERTLRFYDVISILVLVAGLAAVFIFILRRSSDTIAAIGATVYPGERFEYGGGYGQGLFTYGVDLLFGITDKGFGVNTCESATFIDFFPLCLIVPGLVFIRERKKDLLLILLCVLDVFLLIWIVVGFPEFLARITLMSNCQAFRILQMIGFLNILIVFRGLSLMDKPLKPVAAFSLASASMLLSGSVAYFTAVKDYENYLGRNIFLLLCVGIYMVMALVAGMLLMLPGRDLARDPAKDLAPMKKAFSWGVPTTLLIILVMLLAGGIVNPVRRGVEAVSKISWVSEIRKVQEQDREALWAIENTDAYAIPYSEVGFLAGAKTLNSTAIYPNMDLWQLWDPEGKYDRVYNRFAHINLFVQPEGEFRAELVQDTQDVIEIYVTFEDLYRAGVDYVTSKKDLSDCIQENDEYTVERVDTQEDIYIYHITRSLLEE